MRKKHELQKMKVLLGKYETFWLVQLLNTRPAPQLPTLPHISKKNIASFLHINIASNHQKKALENINVLMKQPISSLELMVATWLIYLCRINPVLNEGYTIGWYAGYPHELEKNLFSCLKEYVPLTLEFDAGINILSAFQSALKKFHEVKKKFTYSADICSKQPKAQLWDLGGIPIAIEVVDTIQNFKQKPNVAITIVIDKEGKRCAISQCVKKENQQLALYLENVAAHINTLLAAIALLTPKQWKRSSIFELPILASQEKKLVTQTWSTTQDKKIGSYTISQLFEKHAFKTPNAIAVVFKNKTITYSTLNRRANQLGRYLLKLNITTRSKIAICMESDMDFVISALAVLKIGATYVPISVRYHSLKVERIIEGSQSVLILTKCAQKKTFHHFNLTTVPKNMESLPGLDYGGKNNTLRNRGENYALPSDSPSRKEVPDIKNIGNRYNPTIIYLEEIQPIIQKLSTENLQRKNASQHEACILYTSGSTNEPKGVILQDIAIISRIKQTNYVNFDPSDRVAQIANVAFDAAVFEMWGALANGAQLHIIPREIVLSPKQFSKALHDANVSIMFVTASLFQQTFRLIPNTFDKVKQLLCGGEACDPQVIRKFITRAKLKKLPIVLTNAYGPTETTIFAVTHQISHVDSKAIRVPIGRPIANARVFVLDENLQPLPIGVVGELCIGGVGVSPGYTHESSSKQSNFLNITLENKTHRIYRTGDRVRWLADGNIEYIGRNDTQVKIRGFRVDLSEVQDVLYQYEGIETAIVAPQKEKTGVAHYLAAYIICNGKISPSAIRQFMLLHLPDYMVPASFTKIDEIPLTENGKIDVRKLHQLEEKKFEGKFRDDTCPADALQYTLQKIWSAVLHLDVKKIGIHQDFFLLGGNSLHAAEISAELYRELSIHVGVADIFKKPTIAQLSKYIGKKYSTLAQKETLPITVVGKIDYVPLSLSQKRIAIAQGLDPHSPTYNISQRFHITGKLDLEKFSAGIDVLIQRHEILRANFITKDNQLFQKINAYVGLAHFLEIIPGENLTQTAIEDCVYRDINTPFNLEVDPLLKIKIYALSDKNYQIIFCFHHIIADGRSLEIFYRELSQLYNDHKLPKDTSSTPNLQYTNFAMWQSSLQESSFRVAENYWTNQLTNLKPLALPVDYEPEKNKTYHGKHLTFTIPSLLYKRLKNFAKTEKTSTFSVFLSAFSTLLYRYTYQTDFTTGISIVNRPRRLPKSMMGCFINTLPIRFNFSKKISFLQHLEYVKKKLLKAHEYSEYSLENVLKKLNLKYDPKTSPIFQSIFSFNEFPESDIKLKNLITRKEILNTDTSKADLSVEINVERKGLTGILEYNTALFSLERMSRFIAHFLELLRSIVQNKDLKICDLNILTKEEKKAFSSWNKTDKYIPWTKSVHELFLAQAKRSPQNIALQFEQHTLTYQELSQKSSFLSNYLRSLGGKKGDFIVLSMHRSLEMVIALLAVMEMGGIYVPIDPESPDIRIQHILSNCACKIILTQNNLKQKFEKLTHAVVCSVDLINYNLAPFSARATIKISPEDIAYVIHTSGTTGKPKGVLCTHKGLSNRLLWMQAEYSLTEKDIVLQKTPTSFDVSIWEFFWPLISGAKLLIARPESHKSPACILNTVIKEGVTTLHFVPSMLQVYLTQEDVEQCNSVLKRVISSGETLSARLRDTFLEKLPAVKLYNLYGPTEASIDVTAWDCSLPLKYNALPIGKPIANTRLYVLDTHMQLVPVGVPGELYIGGIGVARGYLNDKKLTDTYFVKDIFSKEPSKNKLYKTGDLVTWLADGSLRFIDRIDNQVKLNGFRIELSEVEQAILKLSIISQCTVVLKNEAHEASGKQLVAYVVPAVGSEKELSITIIRKYLSTFLPEYMIPSVFKVIDKIPLMANGKIDRNALLDSGAGYLLRGKNKYCPPFSARQIILADIWKKILGVSDVGIDESFFDLGGNSITALNFLSAINGQLCIDINIRELFNTPTIRELDQFIEEKYSQNSNYLNVNSLLVNSSKKESSSIVLISHDKNKPPLFLLHPIGGTLFWCLPLARYLSAHYSLYAIQDPGIETPHLRFKLLDELIAFHVVEIKKIKPQGPYSLIGFSSGANLAVELANQLGDQNEAIDFLGLIDGWAVYPKDIYNYDFFKLSMQRQFQGTYSRLPKSDQYDWEKIFALQWQRLTLYEAHTFSKANHKLSLFKAEDILPIYQSIDEPLNHWRSHTDQPIELYPSPGSHESMLQEPNVKTLAEKIIRSMTKTMY